MRHRGCLRALAVAALWLGGAACGGGGGASPGTGGAGGPGGAGGLGGGGAGGGGGGGAGGSTFPQCSGVRLQQDGVLDVDLRAVSISGNVTLERAPLPDHAASRGQLAFSNGPAGASATVDLGTAGAGRYDLRLPPGTYDVAYAPNPALCAPGSAATMPCSGGVLRRAVALTADGVLDVDIPVVTVSGKLTLRGVPLPDLSRARGAVIFTLAGGAGAVTHALGMAGPATYRLNLLPGRYDVAYSGDPAGCAQEAPPAPLPCHAGQLRAGIELAADGVLDLDVPALRVTGTVTLDGAPMPATTTGNRGALVFTAASGGALSTRPFGTTGAATYAVTLWPGRYAVAFAANAALCGPTLAPVVPCLGGTLVTRDLTTDGVLDLDVRGVTVTGTVTLRGQPLPAETLARGSLLFANDAGGSGSVPLGTTGPGSYRMRVVTGTYDVTYVANPMLCAQAAAGTAPQLPCTGGPITRRLALTVDGVLDADLKRVAVSGGVTVRGGPMPAAGGDRGALVFSQAGGAAGAAAVGTRPLGPSGAAAYALSLWPGSYDVALAANATLCGQGQPAPPVPCLGGRLRAAVALESDGVLDVDVPAITVSGAVTLGRAPLPAEAADRGALVVAGAGSAGGGSVRIGLGTSAPAAYAVTLMPGSFVFQHVGNPALCAAGRPLPGVPCASQIVAGCP